MHPQQGFLVRALSAWLLMTIAGSLYTIPSHPEPLDMRRKERLEQEGSYRCVLRTIARRAKEGPQHQNGCVLASPPIRLAGHLKDAKGRSTVPARQPLLGMCFGGPGPACPCCLNLQKGTLKCQVCCYNERQVSVSESSCDHANYTRRSSYISFSLHANFLLWLQHVIRRDE